MAQALFVTTEDIKKFTALNGNVDPDKFIQFVKIAQDTHIQEYLVLVWQAFNVCMK